MWIQGDSTINGQLCLSPLHNESPKTVTVKVTIFSHNKNIISLYLSLSPLLLLLWRGGCSHFPAARAGGLTLQWRPLRRGIHKSKSPPSPAVPPWQGQSFWSGNCPSTIYIRVTTDGNMWGHTWEKPLQRGRWLFSVMSRKYCPCRGIFSHFSMFLVLFL